MSAVIRKVGEMRKTNVRVGPGFSGVFGEPGYILEILEDTEVWKHEEFGFPEGKPGWILRGYSLIQPESADPEPEPAVRLPWWRRLFGTVIPTARVVSK